MSLKSYSGKGSMSGNCKQLYVDDVPTELESLKKLKSKL